MEFLITGGFGHIGSYMMRHFALRGANVTIVDNMETQRFCSLMNLPDQFLSKINIQLKSFDDMTVEDLKKFDLVLHLAAETDAATSFDSERARVIEQTNVYDTIDFIDKCIDADVDKFIFPSTTSVYGSASETVSEDSDPNPQSVYASSKINVEEYLAHIGGSLDWTVLRLGTIFGVSTGMRFHTAINSFCMSASLGTPLKVWSNAMSLKRPYLGLSDAASAIDLVITGGMEAQEIYNVVSENIVLTDVLDEIKKHRDIEIDLVSSPLINQYSYEVSFDKIKAYGYEPHDQVSKGISQTLGVLPWQQPPVSKQ